MPARHPPPRIWLVTDERQGDRLLPAIERLPPNAGILFRHYKLGEDERRRLFERVRARANAAGHMLLLAGTARQAAAWAADGWHGWGVGAGFHSASVHNRQELRRAETSGASLLFVSPVFPTRSHPGAPALGPRRFARLAQLARTPVIALGGVDAARARTLVRLGAHGWAGIDAWLEDEPA